MASFLGFGLLAGAAYAVVFILLARNLGLPVFVASIVAFAVAIPVSYLGNRWVTYRSRNLPGPELVRFLTVQGVNIFVTSAIVQVATAYFDASTYVGVIVAFMAAPIVSLVLFEIWVYRQHS
jgi:putative flippase GtrA